MLLPLGELASYHLAIPLVGETAMLRRISSRKSRWRALVQVARIVDFVLRIIHLHTDPGSGCSRARLPPNAITVLSPGEPLLAGPGDLYGYRFGFGRRNSRITRDNRVYYEEWAKSSRAGCSASGMRLFFTALQKLTI